MSVILTVAGTAAIILGLNDMFHTLLHPKGQGRLSGLVLAAAWRISRMSGHRLGSAVGPAAMVAVILLWVVLQLVGWALIYLPHIPDGFMYSSGVVPSDYPDAMEALYLSAVTLSTLGYGDMVATDPWLRLFSPVEAIMGFALLTAALTWFTQIYPPLSRRRALALELKGFADVGWIETMRQTEPAVLTRVLDSLTAEMGKVRIDFAQHSEGFYFQERNPDLSLARQLSFSLRLRDAAQDFPVVSVSSSGQRLGLAIEQLCSVLDADFVHTGGDAEAVIAAYAAEHAQARRH